MSLNGIFRYPDLYQTAVAVAFISDQRLYDTVYQERYMGLPEGNPDGYRDGSPITFAGNLKGNLLLIHDCCIAMAEGVEPATPNPQRFEQRIELALP